MCLVRPITQSVVVASVAKCYEGLATVVRWVDLFIVSLIRRTLPRALTTADRAVANTRAVITPPSLLAPAHSNPQQAQQPYGEWGPAMAALPPSERAPAISLRHPRHLDVQMMTPGRAATSPLLEQQESWS